MGSPAISDFNLDSEGHCFFCLKQIPIKVKQEPELLATPQLQNSSVHYLARYLGMDMGKVLIEEGPRDPILLTKLIVRKSRLKVELCEKCTSLNKTFSRLYRQLEKMELEIKSSLGLIHGELVGVDQNGIPSTNLSKLRLNTKMVNELSQIVDVLRKEAAQKCSQKLRVPASPRAEIEKLTEKQINAELFKHQLNSRITKMVPETPTSKNRLELQHGNIKSEFSSPNENVLSEDDTRDYDIADYDDNELMDDHHGSHTNFLHDSENDNNVRTGPDISKSFLVIDSGESSSVNKTGKYSHSINTKTGRWKCSACPLEFSSNSGVNHHYRSVHQKIRYRCVPCGKEFVRKHVYDCHHQSAHVGVRLKCLVCNKIFSYKSNLQRHQRTSAGCSKERR